MNIMKKHSAAMMILNQNTEFQDNLNRRIQLQKSIYLANQELKLVQQEITTMTSDAYSVVSLFEEGVNEE